MATIYSVIEALLGLSAPRAVELTVAQVCLRAIVVYIVLIAYVRVGKKRLLGQASAFDAVLLIIIGSISSRAVSGTAPFLASLAATFMFILMHWVISYFDETSPVFGFLTKGTNTILIKNSRIDHIALRCAHMSEEDLMEDLRLHGIDDVKKVKEARLERNGKLSVIEH